MKKQIYIIIILSVIIGHSCKPLQTLRDDNAKSLPASFTGSADTMDAPLINWKQFFSDPYLVSLLDSTIINNRDAQIAIQRTQAAASDILFARSMLRPAVDAGASAGIRKFGLYTMDGAGNITTEIYNGKIVPEHLPDYFIGFQASWEVDIWGKLKNRKKAAIARFLSTVEGRNLIQTNLIAEVATAYYELLNLDQQLKIIDENISIRENAYRMVKVQKEAAVVNELAVKQFEGQLLNIRALKVEILQQIAQTENRINFLTARYPQPIYRDTAAFVNKNLLAVNEGIPAGLLENRPDIRQAEMELAASKADVQSARAAFYPSFNITGAGGFQGFRTSLLFKTPESIIYSLLGSITAPLINRAALKAEFASANARQIEALFNYQKIIMSGYTEVYNEMQRIKNLADIFDLKTKESVAKTQSVGISQQLFRAGKADYLEVLFSQQNALQTQLELTETKKEQLVAGVNLYRALGGGWR